MLKEKTALEEFEEIGFWNMECVKISQINLIKELRRGIKK